MAPFTATLYVNALPTDTVQFRDTTVTARVRFDQPPESVRVDIEVPRP